MSGENLYRGFPQLGWDIRCLDQNPRLLTKKFLLSPKQARRTYPTRILRYWLVYHFLRIEEERLRRPLAVCEIGIDNGQLPRFLTSVGETPGAAPVHCSLWVGVDCEVKPAELAGAGYAKLIQTDIEKSEEWLDGDYDAFILLHVMEHLFAPEETYARIARRMKPGSVMIGGFPSVPHWWIGLKEPHLLRNPDPGSHRSAFSPRRVRAAARAQGLEVDFLSGAFFLRASGLFLEDFSWWLRFNLFFGGLFPSWPGEIYWVLRKPGHAPATVGQK